MAWYIQRPTRTRVGGGVQHARVRLPGNVSFFYSPSPSADISEPVTSCLSLSFMSFSYDNRHPSGVTMKFSWRQCGSMIQNKDSGFGLPRSEEAQLCRLLALYRQSNCLTSL